MNRDEQRDLDALDPDAVIVRETEVVIVPGDTDTTSTDDTSEIRADIEQTRAEMSETINALTERLSPSNLKEQAQEQLHDVKEHVKEQVKEQFYGAKEMVRDATIGRVENMVSNASDTVSDAGSSIMDTIRQNPIPAALVGIGLSWLYMNRRSSSSSRPMRYSGRGGVRGERPYYEDRAYYQERPYYEGQRSYDYNAGAYGGQRGSGGMMDRGQRAVGNVASSVSDRASSVAGTVSDRASSVASTVSDTASSVAGTVSDTASNVASTVSDTASSVASTVSDTASNVVDRAQYQAQRVEDRFENTLQENPLALGAIALALGTAVGLALPQTERENQLMGEARDTLVERAQEVASDTIDKVQRVAGEVASTAQETVQEQAREQGLTA